MLSCCIHSKVSYVKSLDFYIFLMKTIAVLCSVVTELYYVADKLCMQIIINNKCPTLLNISVFLKYFFMLSQKKNLKLIVQKISQCYVMCEKKKKTVDNKKKRLVSQNFLCF